MPAQSVQNQIAKLPRSINKYAAAFIDELYSFMYHKNALRSKNKALHKLSQLLSMLGCEKAKAKVIKNDFADYIPVIYDMLFKDLQAGFAGDPAATSLEEIAVCYPSFKAVFIYRTAHFMYKAGQRVLARVLSETAHRETGIDIHPGAEIGESFFIDHGTGTVIGETCVIGNNVRLYHNITLGARNLNDDESSLRGKKRHPNIGNNVIIYAGTTILGGDTYIMDGSIIGGNVWLTHSVGEKSIVVCDSKCCFRNM